MSTEERLRQLQMVWRDEALTMFYGLTLLTDAFNRLIWDPAVGSTSRRSTTQRRGHGSGWRSSRLPENRTLLVQRPRARQLKTRLSYPNGPVCASQTVNSLLRLRLLQIYIKPSGIRRAWKTSTT